MIIIKMTMNGKTTQHAHCIFGWTDRPATLASCRFRVPSKTKEKKTQTTTKSDDAKKRNITRDMTIFGQNKLSDVCNFERQPRRKD